MYVRLTSFEIENSRLSELSGKIARLGPIAKTVPGVIDIYVAWRGDGRGVIVAVYETEAAAKRAMARLQAVWGDLADLLKSSPRTDVYDCVEHVIG